MEKIFKWTIEHKKTILIIFTLSCIASLFFQARVDVNYDMNDYLPSDSPSTKAIDIMEDEFEGGVANARIMISDLSIVEALVYKEKLEKIDGVSDVLWLDDAINITEPLAIQDSQTVENYYKDNNALYSVTIEEHKGIEAVDSIRELIGNENAMAGTQVNTAVAAESTVEEISKIAKISVLIVFLILLITTNSWFEPFILLITIGVAILLNEGTNILSGTISFVTSGAGSILQLAVTLDYSVFLLHRFQEYREMDNSPEEAMYKALVQSKASILSSGLTTGIGFAALILMRFKIGPDLGIALSKGIIISLVTVFMLLPVLILISHNLLEKTSHRSFLPDFKGFGKLVSKLMIPLVVIFTLTIIPSFLARGQNNYYYGAEHIFGDETKLGQDTKTINEKFDKVNNMVLMVPTGDTAKELELSNRLKDIPEMSDIISFVDNAGAGIPHEYLEENTLNKLQSDNYSRMVLTVNAEYEGEKTFSIIEDIQRIAEDYYPESWYLAGESASTYDLMDTITEDNLRVNLISIGAVFLVLMLTFKSLVIPFILVIAIETAVWINVSVPYFTGSTLFYFSYLIVSSIHLGATVDYAILMTSRYLEFRSEVTKEKAIRKTISIVTGSVLTSGSALVVVGYLLGYITSHGILKQLGTLIGRGAIFSMIIVFFALPGLLYLLDKPIERWTKDVEFINKERE